MTMRLNGQRALRNGFGGAARRCIVAGILASATLVAGCSMLRGGASAPPAADAASTNANAGQQATLRAIGGSAVSGKIRVVDRGNGATVLVSVINIPSRTLRIAFHQNPNCSSPNGFSAGPVWAPPPVAMRAQDLVPTQYANSETVVEAEVRIAGLHATGANGVAGRSVVLYAGPNVTEARPDVPNAAIACGVFEQARPLAF